MTNQTIVMNVPLTFEVDVDGDVSPQTIKDAIAAEYLTDFDALFNEALNRYTSTGEARNFQVEDENTIVIDV